MKNLLILHGWGSSAKKWIDVKNLIEKQNIKVFTIDLPGFGKGPILDRPWSVDDYVDWLYQYIKKIEIKEPFFLLGHSFGGALAVKFTLSYPEKIEKLILVSPALVRKRTFRKSFMKNAAKLFFFLPYSIKELIYRRIIKSDYPLKPGPMKETYLRIIKEDITPVLNKINTPTEIIWGKKDRVTPLKDAYLVQKKILNAELRIIDKAGHRVNLEVSEKLSQIILEFLT